MGDRQREETSVGWILIVHWNPIDINTVPAEYSTLALICTAAAAGPI